MSKNERRFVFFILVLILILSSVLVFKMKSEPKYDEKLYKEIYAEYEKLFEANQSTADSNELNENNNSNSEKSTSRIYLSADANGNEFRVAGKISIPKISVTYPIIYETTDDYLKIAPTKLFGPDVNEVGNLCIVGHNYKNEQFFSKLSELNSGDRIYVTSNDGRNMKYVVYRKYEIQENDMSCTSQNTNGNVELTLITCTSRKKYRLVVKCRAVK